MSTPKTFYPSKDSQLYGSCVYSAQITLAYK
jgi:hypothetical protein